MSGDQRKTEVREKVTRPLSPPFPPRFQVTENQINAQINDAAWQGLMGFEVARARTMMEGGAGLALRLPGRIGWELRLVVQGGLQILQRIESANYDVFRHRPQLRWRDWISVFWRAFRMRGPD